jgi:hypothetical protein
MPRESQPGGGADKWKAPQTGKNRSAESNSDVHANADLKSSVEAQLGDLRRKFDDQADEAVWVERSRAQQFADTQDVFENNEVEYLGSGAENIVFDVSGHPELVAKVHAKTMCERIDRQIMRDLAPDADSPEDKLALRTQAIEARQRHAQLKEYFGQAVLDEKVLRRQVPVTKDLLQSVAGGDQLRLKAASRLEAGKVYKLWTLVRAQERLPEAALDPENSFSLNSRYAELSKDFSELEYERLNADLVDGLGGKAEAYLRDYPELAKLVQRIKAEPQLAEVIQDFIERAVRYTQDTGEILDLAGKSNVRLYKEGETWKMAMPDPSAPERGSWDKANLALLAVSRGEPLPPDRLGSILNSLNYARLLNALASVTHAPKRLRFANDIAEDSVEFLNSLGELPRFASRRRSQRSESTNVIDMEDERAA